ncbi:dUTP pyrophosphatase [Ignavibacterium album JCM 16511]|uniref:Deoxyuridine 5'-triphosphate nucleotidohydrolase n=1 Tax=Ignavibacterium album (strain DSM 19864 / JCM 16511 / NBRC 101810 / Mat9-16) TaxID=945713 RepID=I0AHK6_IGNAJ|nr:dUTP diphosphatase [Ignavibacterium album]AFH48463.1 dUTP pyrophosphatase [Ignavibacterium album JCM 16511]
MSESIEIKVKRLSEEFSDVQLPAYTTEGSAGMDIRAAVKSELIIEPGKVALVPTNISVEIPQGYEIQVRPRSGLAANNSIGILNSPGTIDSDYRGEIKIIMMNFGDEPFIIHRGDRIAQLVVSKVYQAKIIETENLNSSKRGEGGFGHTGKK